MLKREFLSSASLVALMLPLGACFVSAAGPVGDGDGSLHGGARRDGSINLGEVIAASMDGGDDGADSAAADEQSPLAKLDATTSGDGAGADATMSHDAAHPEDAGHPEIDASCSPITCAAEDVNCGSLSDGCGNTLQCGTCTVPETCGGAGTSGVCGAPCGILAPGSELSPGEHLVSCDGRFDLEMQATDGNLVLYFGSTALWTPSTEGNPGADAVMQTDGNFVVYSPASVALWNSGTEGNGGAFLAMQSDGNLVVYSPANAPLWNSGTCCH
jgi:hypothetical protein